jgi:hypothetical protein
VPVEERVGGLHYLKSLDENTEEEQVLEFDLDEVRDQVLSAPAEDSPILDAKNQVHMYQFIY